MHYTARQRLSEEAHDEVPNVLARIPKPIDGFLSKSTDFFKDGGGGIADIGRNPADGVAGISYYGVDGIADIGRSPADSIAGVSGRSFDGLASGFDAA
mmetsp:Transcript_77914/g.174706  ORF Transcript_77914/g.174706 Transcript_77914/m.174706 type:complete len:98 (+) Transcript_77914:72-365(+)